MRVVISVQGRTQDFLKGRRPNRNFLNIMASRVRNIKLT